MERDDIIEYSLDNHHNEEQGKKIRKKIYFVTALLSVVTIVEVAMGIIWGKAHIDVDGAGWLTIKSIFIILTMLKAAYIVMTFMHLGDERKSLRNIILIPYLIFIAYLIFILLVESTFIFDLKQALGWI
ncbi:MAG: cytochrome C oxidase subunit IV family protein [Salibacteraceae bacterium]|jgi:cytochrome c oxidase subunit IV|nr:cytochrome C oxidase subunit IV family protein [Salibacteraceae bacterium]MDP4685497.1 cytochrome C oxidase subunit IV family protein [Salibacteraceae bacterium]MDP4763542.1 cytochrome C oxidase subunit IV family protein [Salibacteraceae bacterium]MDP4845389.1 cytochrome C oxidase subunit IV family protein [Salibacteraceae bacterium]MDP4965566.1 cytochrome C oxidase subunit IV family protein [Salibacteraceae bacterium]